MSTNQQALILSENTEIGRGIAHIDSLEPHSSQRPIAEDFVTQLANELSSGYGIRRQDPIHVVVNVDKGQIPKPLLTQLKAGKEVDFPPSTKFLIIDGQHRWRALNHLRECGFANDNPDFYRWPVIVQSQALASSDLLSVWMTYKNDPGLYHKTSFVDRIVALSKVTEPLERRKLVGMVSKSGKEIEALAYLSDSTLWDAVVKLAKEPLYSTFTYATATTWRIRAIMGDFFLLFFEEMADQRDDIISTIRRHDPAGTLTVFDMLSNKDGDSPEQATKSGIEEHLKHVTRKNAFGIQTKLRVPLGVRGGKVSIEEIFNNFSTRSRRRYDLAIGSPYVFGRVIPLTGDLEKLLMDLMDRWHFITTQLYLFVVGTKFIAPPKRPGSKGVKEWRTWLNLFQDAKRDHYQESPMITDDSLREIFFYIMVNYRQLSSDTCDYKFKDSLSYLDELPDKLSYLPYEYSGAWDGEKGFIKFCERRNLPFNQEALKRFRKPFPAPSISSSAPKRKKPMSEDEASDFEIQRPAPKKPRDNSSAGRSRTRSNRPAPAPTVQLDSASTPTPTPTPAPSSSPSPSPSPPPEPTPRLNRPSAVSRARSTRSTQTPQTRENLATRGLEPTPIQPSREARAQRSNRSQPTALIVQSTVQERETESPIDLDFDVKLADLIDKIRGYAGLSTSKGNEFVEKMLSEVMQETKVLEAELLKTKSVA